MYFITMPEACLLAHTSHHPIKRAIENREIHAQKDDGGHWRIDQTSFLVWALGRFAARGKSTQMGTFGVPQERQSHQDRIAERLSEIQRIAVHRQKQLHEVEQIAWERACDVPVEARSDYLFCLGVISDQREFLNSLQC